MTLQFEKQVEDKRGKILFLSLGTKKINIVEMKKGFARGGHFHNFPSTHIIVHGKIELREENLRNNIEHVKIISAPSIINVQQNIAHLFIALEDSMFIETFDGEYQAVDHPKYRKIVDERLHSIDNNC
jgi:dTDP-4-dehydrorhamnose 3,5-epimerase-like enzyme